jgi:hypothetical protein
MLPQTLILTLSPHPSSAGVWCPAHGICGLGHHILCFYGVVRPAIVCNGKWIPLVILSSSFGVGGAGMVWKEYLSTIRKCEFGSALTLEVDQ